jgi:purine operon repressor
MKYLYLPKGAVRKGEHVLIVDDMVRSGITIDALVKLTEKTRGRIVGVFTLAAMDQSLTRLKERLNLNCPVEALVSLHPQPKHFGF